MRTFQTKSFAAILAPAALILAGGLALSAAEVDDRIEASAKASYNFKTYLKDDTIQIKSSGGMVTLTGTVAQDFHKALAEDTVEGLPGVKGVHNQLMIAGEQPSDHSDNWITMKVKASLGFHKHVSATDTVVHTDKGVVTLTGTAISAAQKTLTGEYAKDVDGVTLVKNELVVANAKPAPETMGEKVDDASITAQVKTSLLFHKATRVLATKVKTKDGVVTLHGEAKNAAEKELVGKIAEDIKGVKHVNNQMTTAKA